MEGALLGNMIALFKYIGGLTSGMEKDYLKKRTKLAKEQMGLCYIHS